MKIAPADEEAEISPNPVEGGGAKKEPELHRQTLDPGFFAPGRYEPRFDALRPPV